jgi:ribose transport system ATP-binding protein
MAALDLGSFSRLGILNLAGESVRIQRIMNQLRLRPPRIESAVGGLSGGNRQKVMLGRALTREFSIFLFDEPTVGIDVGAKLEVYNFISGLVANGAAVVVVSSELPEVLALSNRLYVMHHGRIVAELQDDQRTEQNVLASFFQDRPSPTRALQ